MRLQELESVSQKMRQPENKRGPEGEEKDKVLSLVFDVQTTNSKRLLELALQQVKKYEGSENYKEALRIVGLRDGISFAHCLGRFALLMHLCEGNFVFHQ